MPRSKKERTVLCLGPPHSGKSVFSYILFKHLREMGNDAFVMDGDYYAPTYRRIRISEFVSPEEEEFVITTPNMRKLTALKESVFRTLAQGIHAAIENEGVIILDGIGRHTNSTESLLELADILIVLCPSEFCVETDSEECCYMEDGEKRHPFLFYSDKKAKYMKIQTHFHGERAANFDKEGRLAEIYDLDKEVIDKGDISRIPQETRDIIKEIAEFLLESYI